MKLYTFIDLFEEFINDSQTGKRLRKNGEKIKIGTINTYRYTLNNLKIFEKQTGAEIKLYDFLNLNQKQRIREKRRWKEFYIDFIEFLYAKGCYDNYVGANIKNLRTFFNYLNSERDVTTGNFYKQFYVRKEQIEVLVLSPEQLKLLIHNTALGEKLTTAEKRVKDAFVFGCTTGLRFSDLYNLTDNNLIGQGQELFLEVKSQKTKTFTTVKLPGYARRIIERQNKSTNNATIFKPVSLFIFNRTLKKIGEKAGFTKPISFRREKQGIPHDRYLGKIRFCDKMSSHMMRRTAITTMLTLGMPEHMVRKISGHGPNSTSFERYVHYSNSYISKEIDKFHSKLI